MDYKKLTKEQEREVLESKVIELEMKHRQTEVDLIAVEGVMNAYKSGSDEYKEAAEQVENVRQSLAGFEGALNALYAKIAELWGANRKARRALERKDKKKKQRHLVPVDDEDDEADDPDEETDDEDEPEAEEDPDEDD